MFSLFTKRTVPNTLGHFFCLFGSLTFPVFVFFVRRLEMHYTEDISRRHLQTNSATENKFFDEDFNYIEHTF